MVFASKWPTQDRAYAVALAFVVLIGQVIEILVLPNLHNVRPIASSFDQGSVKVA